MRVKTFTAESTAAAMDMVRDVLGDGAVIVSSDQDDGGRARIVAAIEPSEPANEDIAEHEPAPRDIETDADTAGFLRHVLVTHGVPQFLAARLANKAAEYQGVSAAAALTRAFEHQLGFAPLEPFEDDMPPLVLIGPPGAGKTITAAKICARAHLAKHPVFPVSTDAKRAGGVEQLAAFTRILNLDLQTAPDADSLHGMVRAHRGQPGRLVIDTAGTNPFDTDDMASLGRIIDAADGESIVVLPAGGDAAETADMANLYAQMGATRMIVTRMDIARRYGGIIAAAQAARLPLADVSISHRVVEGLSPITPGVLARLVMPRHDNPPIFTQTAEVDEETP